MRGTTTTSRRGAARILRWTAVLPVTIALTLTLLGATTGPSAAQSAAMRSGDAVVVSPSDGGRTIASGGSQTEFSLALPDGAACPGDSANDNYRVQSFLIPADADPGAIVWRSIGPSGTDQIALYKTDTNQFVQELTEMNTVPGQPGLISPIPTLSFGSYAPTDLSPGPHRLGIACTLYNTTTNYWDVKVDLARDAADQPAQIHWTAASSSSPTSGSSSSGRPSWLYVLAIALALALVIVVVALVRRRPRSPLSLKESR